MKVLGIHDGHTATACLVADGEVKACISEERLNGIKEWYGFPKASVIKILEITNTIPSEIDKVVVAYKIKPMQPEKFSGDKDSFVSSAFMLFKNVFPSSVLRMDWWVGPSIKALSIFRKKKILEYLKSMGIPEKKVVFADHHTCHAHTTLLNPWGISDGLVLTLDGAGDGYCSTVSILKDNKLTTIAKTNLFSSLGWLYARMTQYLGMKPASHEYKVMGLAAYAGNKSRDVYGKLSDFIKVNGMKFENHSGCWGADYFKRFRKTFPNERFDNLAGGLQMLTEELILKWVKNCVKKTGIKTVLCSGGVFMNVKANMRLAKEEFERFFVFPSASDESNAIGAAIYGYGGEMRKLRDIYWGPSYEHIPDVPKGMSCIKIDNIERHIAEELSNGKIIARFRDRMEFGARALGNRSILANPSDLRVIRKINCAIKQRDFWMPFAPTILKEREHDYIVNPSNVKSPYMLIAFDTTKLAQKEILATLHQADLTCRPQVLERSFNPKYHYLIRHFQSITGIGSVLNTSFNLHGYPIVCTPEDAINVFSASELDALAIGSFYITKETV